MVYTICVSYSLLIHSHIFAVHYTHIYKVTSRDYAIDIVSRHHFDEFSCRCYRKMHVSINVERSFPLVSLAKLNWAKYYTNFKPQDCSDASLFLSSSFNQLSLLIAFYWSRLPCVSHSILLSSLQT